MGSQPGRSLDMILGPGETESSLSKVLEDLSLISRTCILRASLVVQMYNPSAGQQRQIDPWGLLAPGIW